MLILNERYPGRFNNPSADYPQGSFKNRTTPTAKDGAYLEQDWANDRLAFYSSLLEAAGIDANGEVDKVGDCQAFEALLQVISQNAKDLFNTPVVNVASAANVNLTTAAPDSRNINITGSASISGFTVAAGQVYIVKFSATATLVNSATIVTGSGTNIVTAPGDSCIIRAIADNSVEVISFVTAIPQPIGYRQSWTDVTASRLRNTNYTNNTGRPISISVFCTGSGVPETTLSINGVVIDRLDDSNAQCNKAVQAIIPAGAVYRVDNASNLQYWMELR